MKSVYNRKRQAKLLYSAKEMCKVKELTKTYIYERLPEAKLEVIADGVCKVSLTLSTSETWEDMLAKKVAILATLQNVLIPVLEPETRIYTWCNNFTPHIELSVMFWGYEIK